MKIPEKAVTVDQLPASVPRPLAAEFALVSTRTLRRWERFGLKGFRRNSRCVSYRKEDLLAFLGLKSS